ncbi:Uncharacterised protein [Citrobacter freundii]|nr:Uncharacterised protein [Citrobacter freundii]
MVLSPWLIRRKPAHCSKAFGPRRLTFSSLLTVLELTVLITPGDDVLRHHARQAGNAGQQGTEAVFRSTADGVHAVFYHRIQLTRQLRLANIVLILAPHR